MLAVAGRLFAVTGRVPAVTGRVLATDRRPRSALNSRGAVSSDTPPVLLGPPRELVNVPHRLIVLKCP